MLDEGAFDDIVAGFYRAGNGGQPWGAALKPLQEALAAWLITLTGLDMGQGTLAFSYEVGTAPAESQMDYLLTYHRIDPHSRLAAGMPPMRWITDQEFFDDAFVARDPYHQEFLLPYGCRHIAGTKLLEEDGLGVLFGIHLSVGAGPITEAQSRICQRLALHLAEAVRLYRRHVNDRFANTLGAELLDRVRAPLMLVDEQRHLLQANAAARRLLETGGSLMERRGELCCRHVRDDTAMLLALRDLGLGREGQVHPGTAQEKRFIRMRSGAGDAHPLGLFLSALRPGSTLGAFGPNPLAMVLVHDPAALQTTLDPYVVAASFDLTPAEARIATGVAHGKTLEAIASENGVALSTVKTQLRHVFDKTGAGRQSELVSALAAMPMAALDLLIRPAEV